MRKREQGAANVDKIIGVFVEAAFAVDEHGVDAFPVEVVDSFLEVGEMLWPAIMARGKLPNAESLFQAARWMVYHFGIQAAKIERRKAWYKAQPTTEQKEAMRRRIAMRR